MSFFADPATDACLNAFGEPFVWQRAGHDDVEAVGIFDSRHMPIDGADGQAPISQMVTQLAVRWSAVDGIAYPHVVLIRDTEYRVRDVRRDGEDMAVLILEKVGDGT